MENNIVSINLQYPDGYVLDSIQEDLYVYQLKFEKYGLVFFFGADKSTGSICYISILENGSSYRLAHISIPANHSSVLKALKNRKLKTTVEKLCPAFDFSKDEYTVFFHKQMEKNWKMFKTTLIDEYTRYANEGLFFDEKSIKWNTIKELQLNSNLVYMLKPFENDCIVESGAENHVAIARFRNPIVLGQLSYEEAKKLVTEIYKGNKQK